MVIDTKPYLARVEVTLKPTVNDPQGNTVQGALLSLGFDMVRGVRVGKYLELQVTAQNSADAERMVDEMCRKLLANPVIEQYTFQVSEAPPN